MGADAPPLSRGGALARLDHLRTAVVDAVGLGLSGRHLYVHAHADWPQLGLRLRTHGRAQHRQRFVVLLLRLPRGGATLLGAIFAIGHCEGRNSGQRVVARKCSYPLIGF
jgi:hypothetical protein